MGRLLPVLIGGLVCSFPASAAGQAPTGDSVTGGATDCVFVVPFCFQPTSVDLNAHSDPSGQHPVGTAAWREQPGSGVVVGDEGPVSCVNVSGSSATIGFSSAPGINRTLIRVTDGGSLAGQDSFAVVEQGRAGLGPPVPPPDCSSFPPTPAGDASITLSGTNDLGDIVVHDAPALPTSKEQCTNGGWRNFTGFKNQGHCVSFVVSHGKNQPSGH
jgi:hypothetical protein